MYSVFAYNSMTLGTIRKQIEDFHLKRKLKPRNRISSVCVFDKGLITNLTKNKVVTPFPTSNSNLWAADNPKVTLKHFFGMIVDYLMMTDIRGGIRYTDYFKIIKKKKS